MDRRTFLSRLSAIPISWKGPPNSIRTPSYAPALSEIPKSSDNPDLTEKSFLSDVEASSYVSTPPWGYSPKNAIGQNMSVGWQADRQMAGAWLTILFPQPHPVQELWILGRPIPSAIIGKDIYLELHSRASLYAPPRQIEVKFSDNTSMEVELRNCDYFQLVTLPEPKITRIVHIYVREVWAEPGAQETGIGKVRIFPHSHSMGAEVRVHPLYDARESEPVQTASLNITNPWDPITTANVCIFENKGVLAKIPLKAIPARSSTTQRIWIPAPFSDSEVDFSVEVRDTLIGRPQTVQIPAYHCYFDGGIFAFNCTCHNDLGWLDTPEKTADARSSEIILPALKMLHENPEFCYSMESTVFLMEFLDRHPEKREEMYELMKQDRFAWGASYVQCLEAHIGPENLVRQFYYGRRWLRENFPGVDSVTYYKTDPPSLTLQMPQILAKSGVKYLVQGRIPFGLWKWEAPDGSSVLTYPIAATHLMDPKGGDDGWLPFAVGREPYYASHKLPHELMFDYSYDFLPPQPDLPEYVREQNESMRRFAESWNNHMAALPTRKIHPPKLVFSTVAAFLEKFTEDAQAIPTLKGDYPLNWAYYDEPSHREGLVAARLAHNRLLVAERINVGIALEDGFQSYPQHDFTMGWMANCWPDHGWGGGKDAETDAVLVASYEKSKTIADDLLKQAGSRLVRKVQQSTGGQVAVVVFNPLTWERTDIVEFKFDMPLDWKGFVLCDENGQGVPFEIVDSRPGIPLFDVAFVAESVPSLGYKTFYLSSARPQEDRKAWSGEIIDNKFYKIAFGRAGIKSLYHKRLNWDVIRGDKFEAGEVIQFTAPGYVWDSKIVVTLEDFDRTSNHPFPFQASTRSPIRTTAVRTAVFPHFRLRETFHFYEQLDRIDINVELLDWDGERGKELRVVFPINLGESRITYEVPFGKVELGEDEIDFSMLSFDPFTIFQNIFGGDPPLPFREAINWVDASEKRYLGRGCLTASDMTVHLFEDQSAQPVSYPLLQHVLLSTRKSMAWEPGTWFTQEGSHNYRMCLLPHQGSWRSRYREGVAFNHPLVAFVGSKEENEGRNAGLTRGTFLSLEPSNLMLTSMKKSEAGDHVVIRFYEAEGNECDAFVRFPKPISGAKRTNLIEEDGELVSPQADGSLRFSAKPWEIVTLRVAF